MNVTVETLGSCKKLVKIEVDAAAVDKAIHELEAEYQKNAALPGFRKGKAPAEMILRQFGKTIDDEAKRKLTGESFRQAMKEQQLEAVTVTDVEDIQFERGKPMQFAATVETGPEYELPEYRGLPAQREDARVSEEDIENAIKALRERSATFIDVDHEVRDNDFVVVNYQGTCESQPITAVAPASRGLAEQKAFWIEVKPDSFIPGFATQLLGAKVGEHRTVNVDFPGDFVSSALAGKKGVYEVDVVGVKEKKLPDMDDAFAKQWEADTMVTLREGVRRDLQNELNERQARHVRAQVVVNLMRQIKCDLPESVVAAETRSVVYEMVNENQRRGVPKEVIEKEKDKIYNASRGVAMERVKANFVFKRIAEKEGITVTGQEFETELFAMAKSMQMSIEKLKKEMQKGDGGDHVIQGILNNKVISFLKDQARIEVVPPGQLKHPEA